MHKKEVCFDCYRFEILSLSDLTSTPISPTCISALSACHVNISHNGRLKTQRTVYHTRIESSSRDQAVSLGKQ